MATRLCPLAALAGRIARRASRRSGRAAAMRGDHPLARERPTRATLGRLSYVLVCSLAATARTIDALGPPETVVAMCGGRR